MHLIPLGKKVTVRPLTLGERTTEAGIVIPAQRTSEARIDRGRVVAKGADVDVEIEPGDLVLFNQYAGASVQVENDEVMLLHQDDITGVFRS